MLQYTIPNPSLIWKPLDRITSHQGAISVDCRISNFPHYPWWCALKAKQGTLASEGATEWMTVTRTEHGTAYWEEGKFKEKDFSSPEDIQSQKGSALWQCISELNDRSHKICLISWTF